MDAEKEVYRLVRNAMLSGLWFGALLWSAHIVVSHFVGGVWTAVVVFAVGVWLGCLLAVLAALYTECVLDVVGFRKPKT